MKNGRLALVVGLLGAAALSVLACWTVISGSVLVIDQTGAVTSAVLNDGYGNKKRLLRLAGGYFYASPVIEGAIEVRCGNVARRGGYVTAGLHANAWVKGPTPCAQLIMGY